MMVFIRLTSEGESVYVNAEHISGIKRHAIDRQEAEIVMSNGHKFVVDQTTDEAAHEIFKQGNGFSG